MTAEVVQQRRRALTREERKVIIASSAGTVFEWYDFYLYGALVAIIGAQFFAAYSATQQSIFALLTFAAGFIVRPFGAVLFGRLGDLVGRKYTFVVTVVLMGAATFLVGLLPGYDSIGSAAPIALIALRMLQGLAAGGEYGGAAIYVAEHAPQNQRGYFTGLGQHDLDAGATPLAHRHHVHADRRRRELPAAAPAGRLQPQPIQGLGLAHPVLFSIVLLLISLYVRLQMQESPGVRAHESGGHHILGTAA